MMLKDNLISKANCLQKDNFTAMTNFNKAFNYNYHYVRILIKYICLLWKNQDGRQTTTRPEWWKDPRWPSQ